MNDEELPEGVPIVDIAEAQRLGLLKKNGPGWCFANPGYDEKSDVCARCFESDRCAQATAERYNAFVISAEAAQPKLDPERVAAMMLPKAFAAFELGMRNKEVLPHVARISKERHILYIYKSKKLVSVVQPIASDSITLMFHNCRLKDFKDIRNELWVGDKRAPLKPFLFVEPSAIGYALALIKQLHRKMQHEFERLNEEKFNNVKRSVKDESIQRPKALDIVRGRKGEVACAPGQRIRSSRQEEAPAHLPAEFEE